MADPQAAHRHAPPRHSATLEIIPYHDGLDLATLDCHAVEEFSTANGPADYGLLVGGRLLAIIEAKKVRVNPQNGVP